MNDWRMIPRYEGIYEVNDSGAVRSLDRIVRRGNSKMRLRGKTLHPTPDAHGYLVVTLHSADNSHKRRIHTLVAEAFIGPRPRGMLVCHRNDRPDDNRVTNLYYGTSTENARDAIRNNGGTANSRLDCCPSGHPYDEANTKLSHRRDGTTFRTCKECVREFHRRARENGRYDERVKSHVDCDQCGKSLSYSNFRRHVKEVHEGHVRDCCGNCGCGR